MSRQYFAKENLDGPATRIDSLQDMDAASLAAGDVNADAYNPPRTTTFVTVGWLLSIYAGAANTDKIYVVPVEGATLQVGDVVSQATHVLSAGESVRMFLAGADDSSPLLQYAADNNNQQVRIELFEVKERR